MKYAAALFDMDGLLLETERLILGCFVETRRHFNLSDSPETLLDCIGKSEALSDKIIADSLNQTVAFLTFKDKLNENISTRFEGPIPVRPGATELFEALTAKGIAIGIATTTKSERARSHLEKTGLLKHVKALVGGDMVEKHKPNPEPYLEVARRLGVSATDCVAFEDSDTGTRAAIASGATTVQIPDLVKPSEETKKLGHTITPHLLMGALEIGLILSSDFQGELPII